MKKIPSSEITAERVYFSRRAVLGGAGTLGVAALLAACGASTPAAITSTTEASSDSVAEPKVSDELGDPANSFEQISNYNNYYEFTVDKQGVAGLAASFNSSPWQIEVGGLVNKPRTFALEDLLKIEHEERIYRLRCVEAWSMVIPWNGFPLNKLLAAVEPKPEARYVRFETVFRPDEMPGQGNRSYPWPYVEGLRLDEAMHDLTLLATGVYGQAMPAQNGAPVRLVVPWKYGFKSIKSIVKIELVETPPTSLWMQLSPNEYGFYANVNPDVSHPRWSQSSERRIGEFGRRPTLSFNGYAEEVAGLYAGMDLRANY